MNVSKFSLFIKITNATLDEIKKIVLKYKPTINQAYWLKIKDIQADFYEISFDNISMEEFKEVCIRVNKLALIEEINLCFEHNADCLLLLQDKGFNRYEETEYVDFKYPKRNVLIGMTKEEGYKLKAQQLEDTEMIDVQYFFRLIERVFEIVRSEGEN